MKIPRFREQSQDLIRSFKIFNKIFSRNEGVTGKREKKINEVKERRKKKIFPSSVFFPKTSDSSSFLNFPFLNLLFLRLAILPVSLIFPVF
jgi:hypothetical protein